MPPLNLRLSGFVRLTLILERILSYQWTNRLSQIYQSFLLSGVNYKLFTLMSVIPTLFISHHGVLNTSPLTKDDLSLHIVMRAANSLRIAFQWPLHSLCETIGRNKVTIRGSCSSNPQKGMLMVIVNNRSAYFPIYLFHDNAIKRWTTTMCVLYRLLIRASNNNSISVSIASVKGVHDILSPIFLPQTSPLLLGLSTCLSTKILTTASGCRTFQSLISSTTQMARTPDLSSPPPPSPPPHKFPSR